MIVKDHIWLPLGRCMFCPARRDDPERPECVERDDFTGKPQPEPRFRQIACEDTDAIQAALAVIRETEKPKCPRGNGMTLYNCLRTGNRCPAECPAYADWIGPDDPLVSFAAGAFC